MTKMFKLVTQEYTTHSGMAWMIGKTNKATGRGTAMCSNQVLHCYSDPYLAVLFNPVHANIHNPILLEIECSSIINTDGLKHACKEQTPVKQITLPEITLTQKVAFAIKCALLLYKEASFVNWANCWLNGADRTAATARAAADAARAAAAADAAYAAAAADAARAAAAADAARADTAAAYAAYAAYTATARAAADAARAAAADAAYAARAADAAAYADTAAAYAAYAARAAAAADAAYAARAAARAAADADAAADAAAAYTARAAADADADAAADAAAAYTARAAADAAYAAIGNTFIKIIKEVITNY